MIQAFIAIVAAMLIHESGHFLAALFFGHRLRFEFSLGHLLRKIPVPRFTWRMPNMERWKQRVVAMAGFGAELFATVVLLFTWPGWALWYVPITFVHFALYPHYAGESSDFNFWR
nr:hypothetical protein [uncultured Fretibacterium sp.]